MAEELWQYESIHQVEWFAAFLMKFGYIPSSAWGRHYSSPAAVCRRRGQHNIARPTYTLNGMTLTLLGHSEWKQCPECGCRYPATNNYFPVNSDGRRGLYSKCRYCKRAADNARYQTRIGCSN